MNDEHYEMLYRKIHDYVTRELEKSTTPEQQDEFAELIHGSSLARQIYVAYMQEQTSLRWSYANQPLDILEQAVQEAVGSKEAKVEPPQARKTRPIVATALGACAAVIVVAATVWLALGSVSLQGEEKQASASTERAEDAHVQSAPVATITRMIDVEWAEGAISPMELSRLRPGQTLDLASGQIELLFDSGVEVILNGQTHFRICSAGSAYSERGSISARVGEEARGFTIETPNARVIDLGTEFGVSISESGETEVAVFRGIVDLALDRSEATESQSITKRLNQGEALRVGSNGMLHRVFAVPSDRFPLSVAARPAPTGRPPLISDVRDNIRDPESKKFYKIVRSGLYEDTPAFVDRDHQWNGIDDNGIPDYLLGAEYVMPFNDDKKFRSRLEVTLFVARPISLYLLLSDTVDTPDWLVESKFVDTGDDIGLDEGPSRWHPAKTGRRTLAVGPGRSVDTRFSIWKRDVLTPEEVVLGGLKRPVEVAGYNMYGIAAVPLANEE